MYLKRTFLSKVIPRLKLKNFFVVKKYFAGTNDGTRHVDSSSPTPLRVHQVPPRVQLTNSISESPLKIDPQKKVSKEPLLKINL